MIERQVSGSKAFAAALFSLLLLALLAYGDDEQRHDAETAVVVLNIENMT